MEIESTRGPGKSVGRLLYGERGDEIPSTFFELLDAANAKPWVPPMTVRYEMKKTFFVRNFQALGSSIGKMMVQLNLLLGRGDDGDTLAYTRIDFPATAGRARFVHVSFRSRTHFEKAAGHTFRLNGGDVIPRKKGAIIPPTATTVKIHVHGFVHSPEHVLKALQDMIISYNSIHCHDQQSHSGAEAPSQLELKVAWALAFDPPAEMRTPMVDSGIVLAVLKLPADRPPPELQIAFEDRDISYPFYAAERIPAFLKVGDSKYPMYFRGRLNTCGYCKEHRVDGHFHEFHECKKMACYTCGKKGHHARDCPTSSNSNTAGDGQNVDVEDVKERSATFNKETRSSRGKAPKDSKTTRKSD